MRALLLLLVLAPGCLNSPTPAPRPDEPGPFDASPGSADGAIFDGSVAPDSAPLDANSPDAGDADGGVSSNCSPPCAGGEVCVLGKCMLMQ